MAVLEAWGGLARAVFLCGDYGEACDIVEDAHAYAIEHLGPEHPLALRIAKDLSIAWRRADDGQRSLELARDVHSGCKRTLGSTHPDSLAAAVCLSNALRELGGLESAAALALEALEEHTNIYGNAHLIRMAAGATSPSYGVSLESRRRQGP